MRYFKELSTEYVDNGKSRVKGETIQTIPHPMNPDRMVKVFVVQDVVKQSETNLIVPGSILGLSFSKMNINSRDYTWKPEEEKMAPLQVQLT